MRLLIASAVLLLSLSLLPRSTVAALRTNLIELWTSTSCDECVHVASSFSSSIRASTRLVGIFYHTGAADVTNPFYLANVVETEARRRQLDVRSIPTCALDGMRSLLGDPYCQYHFAQRSRLPSAIEMQLSGTRDDDASSGQLVVTIAPESGLRGRWELVVVITEWEIPYAAPNGMRHHDAVFRQFITGVDGISVDLADGAPRSHVLDFATDSAWNLRRVRFVAFVRNRMTGEVEQAARGHFDDLVSVETTSWGRIKASFRD